MGSDGERLKRSSGAHIAGESCGSEPQLESIELFAAHCYAAVGIGGVLLHWPTEVPAAATGNR